MIWLLIVQALGLLLWYPLGKTAQRSDEPCPTEK